MGDSKVLGCHQIEKLRGRLEIENLILNENFGVAQFVPTLFCLHDPNEGGSLPGELLIAEKVPEQKVGMDSGSAAGGELITVFYSIESLNSLDVFLCVQFFHDLVPSISASVGSLSETTNKRNKLLSVDNNIIITLIKYKHLYVEYYVVLYYLNFNLENEISQFRNESFPDFLKVN